MAGPPNIFLLGYGVLDSLQVTVETQQLLTRYGHAYSLGLPPNLAAYLKSQRVKVTDISARLAPGRPFGEAYLDIANFLIERTTSELPVIFLAPGNPLATNAIGRYLAMEGPRLGLTVQAVPGISQLDAIIAAIGLDVSTFGLQVFDATKLVARKHALNPRVPLLLLHAGGFELAAIPEGPGEADLRPLAAYLGACYPPDHPVVAVDIQVAPPALTTSVVALAGLAATSARIPTGASLFVDAVREAR
jgi:siroheme synthase